MDGDGFVYIVDRAKDIIIRGGENISCAEVEAALFSHPAIRLAAVVGVPHERLGECVQAVVALHSGHLVTEDTLIQFLSGQLARYKVPHAVHIWPDLPTLATGKTDKQDIRRRLGRTKL